MAQLFSHGWMANPRVPPGTLLTEFNAVPDGHNPRYSKTGPAKLRLVVDSLYSRAKSESNVTIDESKYKRK